MTNKKFASVKLRLTDKTRLHCGRSHQGSQTGFQQQQLFELPLLLVLVLPLSYHLSSVKRYTIKSKINMTTNLSKTQLYRRISHENASNYECSSIQIDKTLIKFMHPHEIEKISQTWNITFGSCIDKNKTKKNSR